MDNFRLEQEVRKLRQEVEQIYGELDIAASTVGNLLANAFGPGPALQMVRSLRARGRHPDFNVGGERFQKRLLFHLQNFQNKRP